MNTYQIKYVTSLDVLEEIQASGMYQDSGPFVKFYVTEESPLAKIENLPAGFSSHPRTYNVAIVNLQPGMVVRIKPEEPVKSISISRFDEDGAHALKITRSQL